MLLAEMQDSSKGIVAKDLETEKYLVEFMQINLDVDTTWKERLFYVVWMQNHDKLY